ncbi:Tic20 family protein [Geitlerinema sp. PCC 9228]|jgi:uncharacterized membrane protein|uniref:Tic20 family protein n=1 Tax=Geitlerinema sp. PCC 9228 TaxID=111611 RepID=UPI0008F9E0CE|nr:Tic20 family protein [Geitlerinema sp. PCC 9228]
MTWRQSTTPGQRILACLPYLLPLLEVTVRFSQPLLSQFPFLSIFFVPLAPLIQLYASVPFAPLIAFLLLIFLVVRNTNIAHFIRFNTMQAILLDIALFLASLLVRFLIQPIGNQLLLETLANTIFLGVVAAVVFSIAQSLRGLYAEIPTISDAAYLQVR